MRCEGAVALDVVAPESTGLVSLAARAHVRGCPQCRRELEAQRRLQGVLHGLAPRPVPGELRGLADGLLAGILAALDAEDRRTARRSALALAGAAFTGGLVAVGAVVVARRRG